jgi:glutamate-ammonia-ligase adenylyltransferase
VTREDDRPAPLAALIERCADPARVTTVITQLTEADPLLADRLTDDAELRSRLITVAAASRSLSRLLVTRPQALAVLLDLDQRPPIEDTTVEHLVAWKHLEYLRIASRDLAGLDDLATVGRALSRLARDVLASACLLARTEGLAVIGMGKLGGDELNYSSDIDVMFVGDGLAGPLDQQARAVMDIARRCFRVDANLRPEGRDGRLTRSLDGYEAYWDRWAQPWEFQALLKARPAAGDPTLGVRFHDTAQRWLWSHPFSAEDLRSLRAMKQRAEQEVARRGSADRELKRGPGGIRDIEFTIQLLQLVHGHADPDLRSPTTLIALEELAGAGYVDPRDATKMADAYVLLRTVEHRLQLADEQQVHSLPTLAAELDHLARVLGYRDAPDAVAAQQMERELRSRQLAVRAIHEQVYFRPLLEGFASSASELSPEAAVERLRAFGFTDAKRTRAAVGELTRGLNRTSRLMKQLLPLLLDWLSSTPDPDLGLLQLRNLFSATGRRTSLVEAFRDSPDAARRLCQVLGSSRLLGDVLARNPDVVARLPSSERLQTQPRDELIRNALRVIGWRTDRADQQEGLHRWHDRHFLGVAARDLFGFADVSEVGRDLSRLAEAALEAALEVLEPTLPFAVIALGRFGGAELSYASDLDVVFVYDGSGADAFEEANRLAASLQRFVGGATPADCIYQIDADLRPEGRQGPLARSLDGFNAYWERYAEVWERQAMTRARPVAGDLELGARLLEELAPRVWDGGLTAEEARDIRRMKARIEHERIPAGEDPAFHLKLGKGSLSDVEFTAQLLQLRHGLRAPGTVAALELLAEHGRLDPADAATLLESYRFCERTRNRWFLVNSAPGDSMPTDPSEQLWLARSLDMNTGELREEYRRVTRRARRVVERVFYEKQ